MTQIKNRDDLKAELARRIDMLDGQIRAGHAAKWPSEKAKAESQNRAAGVRAGLCEALDLIRTWENGEIEAMLDEPPAEGAVR